MLSRTQSTLKGRSPESTPQIRAGKGSFTRGFARRSISPEPMPTVAPFANTSTPCSIFLSDLFFLDLDSPIPRTLFCRLSRDDIRVAGLLQDLKLYLFRQEFAFFQKKN